MSENILQEDEYGLKTKTLESYVRGFILCLILTLIPFFAIKNRMFTGTAMYLLIFTTALLQFLVQTFYFMCLSTRTQQGINQVLAFAFMLLIVMVLVGGSLWIMWNLNWNMHY
ncbi:MAG TPA: cytochrome o ubiquinol oxidase subunit IV [Gammaproteobacteria bacterium]|nr:cytochrome o ubiquinol oxidase subunit IV [Gammaproteobacteria bacterium]